MNRDWGHIQFAGDRSGRSSGTTSALEPVDLSGDAMGWGVNVSTNLKFGQGHVPRLGRLRRGDPELHERRAGGHRHHDGPGGPRRGSTARRCRSWASSRSTTPPGDPSWTSSFGYSLVDIDNSDLQAASAFQKGQYALANLLYYPVKNVMIGPELQWGKRDEQLRRVHLGRLPHPVLGQVQLQASVRRPVMRRAIAVARGRWPLQWPARGPPPGRRRPTEINAALKAAHDKYKNLKEGSNADYIPALAKVDSEHLRHRARDDGRQGLHGGRHQVRGVDPVDLQGLHHGPGHGGAGPGRDREQHGRRRDRPGASTRSSPSSSTRAPR